MTFNTASASRSLQNFAGQVDKSPYLGGWFELLLNFNDADEQKSIGIEQLLSDNDDTIALVPENNERHERRQ